MKTAEQQLSTGSRVLRRAVNTAKSLKPRRAMTTTQRRAIQQDAANDPNVGRALQEVLAAHPELRSKTHA